MLNDMCLNDTYMYSVLQETVHVRELVNSNRPSNIICHTSTSQRSYCTVLFVKKYFHNHQCTHSSTDRFLKHVLYLKHDLLYVRMSYCSLFNRFHGFIQYSSPVHEHNIGN